MRSFLALPILLLASILALADEPRILDATDLLLIPAEALQMDGDHGSGNLQPPIGTQSTRITLSPDTELATIDSPLLRIEPGKRYKIRVHLFLQAYQPETELDLLVREHTQATGRPLQPYQKIALANRPVQPDQEGTWITRHLLVETTDQTQFLSFIVAIRHGPATILIGGADLTPGEREQRAVELLLAELQAKGATRQRVADRTYVMPRSQLKYGLDRNYLHWWHDRPLLTNRATRDSYLNVYRLNEPSFKREVAMAKLYGLDGFAALTVSEGQLTNYQLASRYLAEWDADDFIVYPELWGAGDRTDDYIERYLTAIRTALASTHSFRVHGKPVITSYIGDGWTPEQLAEVMARLKAAVGDSFYFVADMRHGLPVLPFQKGLLTVEDLQAEQARLRRYLDVCDGIMFMGANHLKVYYADEAYGDSINAAYISELLVPLFTSVLAEEPYHDKLLGLSAAVSYVNVRGGDAKREDRTRSLRRTLEAVLPAQPDFIGFPEWNEYNENTCLSPTIFRSLSSQRIVRYYTHRLRGEPPTANPGDDRSIPNLILSYRRVLKLGETLHLELLHVPDGTETDTYTAELALLDLQGQLVRQFPPHRFTINELEEQTWSLGTEELADHRALVPRLVIRRDGQEPLIYDHHFLHVHLDATWNWNYLCVKQPLRDLMRPASASFAAERLPNGKVRLAGELQVDEPLNTVEVLRNGTEVYAVDRLDEFKRDNYVTLQIDTISWRGQDFHGTLRLRGASDLYARPVATDNFADSNATDTGSFVVEGDTVRFDGVITRAGRGFFLSLPREDVATTTLELRSNLGDLTLPLAELQTAYAKAFPNQVMITVDIPTRLADLPVPVDAVSTAFSYELTADPEPAIFHLRAVSQAGRIYRSRPVLVGDATAPPRPLPVYVDRQAAPTTVTVAADRILDLDYSFTPRHGDLLATPAGRRWWGELGGGLEYGAPFNRNANYPRSATDSSPEWVQEDDRWCLQFDGKGHYVNFPHETLPRGAFSLTMEIKPEADHPQVLLRSHGIRVGAILLKLVDGELRGTYVDTKLGRHELTPGLSVPTAQWSTIRVSYDLQHLRFQVNEDAAEPIPLSVTTHTYTPCVFGGHTKPGFGVDPGDGFFRGKLRRFHLVHAPR